MAVAGATNCMLQKPTFFTSCCVGRSVAAAGVFDCIDRCECAPALDLAGDMFCKVLSLHCTLCGTPPLPCAPGVALRGPCCAVPPYVGLPPVSCQVPNVSWDDVGGLEEVKQAILDTIELPLKHR